MLEKLLDVPGAAEESSFFADGCPTNMLTLQPHQQAQVSLSTTGGFGLSSAEARRMSEIVGSLVATVPEVFADLSGAIGNKVRRELSDSDLVRRTWNSVRDLRDVLRVSEKATANIVPETWRDRAFRAGEQGASRQSVADVLPEHDAETISSSKAQHRLGYLVNRVCYERYVFAGPSPRDEAIAIHRRLSRREGDARFGQGPATKSIGTRGYRLPKGKAYRLS